MSPVVGASTGYAAARKTSGICPELLVAESNGRHLYQVQQGAGATQHSYRGTLALLLQFGSRQAGVNLSRIGADVNNVQTMLSSI